MTVLFYVNVLPKMVGFAAVTLVDLAEFSSAIFFLFINTQLLVIAKYLL